MVHRKMLSPPLVALFLALWMGAFDSVQQQGTAVREDDVAEVAWKLDELGASYFRGMHQRPDEETIDWFRRRAEATVALSSQRARRAIDKDATDEEIARFQRAFFFAAIVSRDAALDVMEELFSAADSRIRIIDAAYVLDRANLRAAMPLDDWEWSERLRGLRQYALDACRDDGRSTLVEEAKRLLETDHATVTAAVSYLRQRSAGNPDLRAFLLQKKMDRRSRAYEHPGLQGLNGERKKGTEAGAGV